MPIIAQIMLFSGISATQLSNIKKLGLLSISRLEAMNIKNVVN